MGFGKSVDSKNLRYANSKELLEAVSSAEIFDHYLGGIPNKAINSPLRNDVTPSFSIFYSDKYDDIFYKDFSTGETGNAIIFVMRLFKFRKLTDAINKIVVDFSLSQFRSDKLLHSKPKFNPSHNDKKLKIKSRNRLDIKVRVRVWNKNDKEYWHGKYGFSKEMLEYCNVYPISHFFVNGNCTVANLFSYAFLEGKDDNQTFKIYQPYADNNNKWFNNNDYSTWELWTQLPESGDVVIIASSRKDAMVIKSLFPSNRITACALQSESVNPKESVVEELKNRFKYVFILYDNDQFKVPNAGKVAGEKIAKRFDIMEILIPDIFQLKDPSDFREKQGRENTRKMLISIIKKRIKKYNT